MGILSFTARAFRYAFRYYEWLRGRRHYPWTSTPPHRLFALIANRAYGWPGAHYRAMYGLAGGLLKYRERLYADRVNFFATLGAPVNSQTLLNAALWQRAILATPPMAPKVHATLRVSDAEQVQLDRLMSVLLMSDNLRTINVLFDETAARNARLTYVTVAEESRGWATNAYDLNSSHAIEGNFQDVDWSVIFSNRTGFDRNVNNYLKIAHPGAFVVALALPETDDGFCDKWLDAWREAIESFRSPVESISFVVLNAFSPGAFSFYEKRRSTPFSFARSAGLSLAETVCLAQKADAFIGYMNIFGLAARAALRPGVYLGRAPEEFARSADHTVHALDMAPAEALERLRGILERTGQSAAPTAAIAAPPTIPAPRAARATQNPGVGAKYTLVVPTYNRPELLNRLLGYLERAHAAFPVLVLDSSKPEILSRNKSAISALSLDVRHCVYDGQIDPYAKMREGLNAVVTPYCSICADDDLVLIPAIQRCIKALERDPHAALAHGAYFNFQETATFDLSFVVYRSKSVEQPHPIARVRSLFAAYEALLYGVFRADVARKAFRDVDNMETVLGKELLTAGVSVIAGKAVRVGDFYYGRNTAESLAYTAWHPHQILADRPELLFTQYPVLRDILLHALSESDPGLDSAASKKALDLIFLRYVQPFLRPEVLDVMLDLTVRGSDSAAIVTKVWDVFVRSTRTSHPVEPLLDSRGAFVPTQMGSGRPRDYQWSSPSWNGRDRTYKVFFEFLFPNMQPSALVDSEKLVSLLHSLNAY